MNKSLWLLVALLATNAHAGVTVEQAWARATAPGQDVGGVFMQITSSKTAVLTGASCDCAAEVQIHESLLEKGMARMRQRDEVALPAAKTVEFKPGGLHIMLFDLKAPLKAGDKLPLKLRVLEKGKVAWVPVSADVLPLGEHHHHD